MTIYYLDMKSPSDYSPKRIHHPHLHIDEVKLPYPEFNKFLYDVVGQQWNWRDKHQWTPQQWQHYVTMPELRTWVAYIEGAPAGYFELKRQHNGSVQIVYFGLLPQFIGQGLGGHLLSEAIEQAWGMGAQRIWLHTCSDDHPRALHNYQSRGFRIYKQAEKPIHS